MPLCIRHPLPEEELGPFFDLPYCPIHWNLEQVYVAAALTRLVGIAIVFDGGHDVVLVDYVRVLPPWESRGLSLRLLLHIEAEMRTKGKRALIGYANQEQIARMACMQGATVGQQWHYALRKEL